MVAKGGPKNLTPMAPVDPDHPTPDAQGMTIAQFADRFLNVDPDGYFTNPRVPGAVILPVDDETGITGSFNLWSEDGPFGQAGFSPANPPGMYHPDGQAPETLAALLNDKLGLTLIKKRATREFIAVIHVERPTPD